VPEAGALDLGVQPGRLPGRILGGAAAAHDDLVVGPLVLFGVRLDQGPAAGVDEVAPEKLVVLDVPGDDRQVAAGEVDVLREQGAVQEGELARRGVVVREPERVKLGDRRRLQELRRHHQHAALRAEGESEHVAGDGGKRHRPLVVVGTHVRLAEDRRVAEGVADPLGAGVDGCCVRHPPDCRAGAYRPNEARWLRKASWACWAATVRFCGVTDQGVVDLGVADQRPAAPGEGDRPAARHRRGGDEGDVDRGVIGIAAHPLAGDRHGRPAGARGAPHSISRP
jgi:hypothetical protein